MTETEHCTSSLRTWVQWSPVTGQGQIEDVSRRFIGFATDPSAEKRHLKELNLQNEHLLQLIH